MQWRFTTPGEAATGRRRDDAGRFQRSVASDTAAAAARAAPKAGGQGTYRRWKGK